MKLYRSNNDSELRFGAWADPDMTDAIELPLINSVGYAVSNVILTKDTHIIDKGIVAVKKEALAS